MEDTSEREKISDEEIKDLMEEEQGIKTEKIETGEKKKKYKVVTTTISNEFYDLARRKGIRWKDAMARGIRLLTEESHIEADLQMQKETIERINRKMIVLEGENDQLKKEVDQFKKEKEAATYG